MAVNPLADNPITRLERCISRIMDIVPWQLAQTVYVTAIVLLAIWLTD